MIAKDLQTTFTNAVTEATSRRHEYITLEHLLFALIDDPSAREVLHNCGADLDALNQALLNRVNATGEVMLSHTRVDGAFVLRLAVGHLRTAEPPVARAWKLLREHAEALKGLRPREA